MGRFLGITVQKGWPRVGDWMGALKNTLRNVYDRHGRGPTVGSTSSSTSTFKQETLTPPGLTSVSQAVVNFHRCTLLLVPQWLCISSVVFYIQSACTSMCRYLCDWNTVNCDVKQPVHLALLHRYIFSIIIWGIISYVASTFSYILILIT